MVIIGKAFMLSKDINGDKWVLMRQLHTGYLYEDKSSNCWYTVDDQAHCAIRMSTDTAHFVGFGTRASNKAKALSVEEIREWIAEH